VGATESRARDEELKKIAVAFAASIYALLGYTVWRIEATANVNEYEKFNYWSLPSILDFVFVAIVLAIAAIIVLLVKVKEISDDTQKTAGAKQKRANLQACAGAVFYRYFFVRDDYFWDYVDATGIHRYTTIACSG
jgi:NADH:ubiquinone oxidoreductase subunit 6 (subunit J)